MEKLKLRYLRYLGYTEAASLLILLFVAMPAKYFGQNPTYSKVVGTLHGCLFLMYGVTLVTTGKSLGFSRKQIGLGFILSCMPFGPFIFESRLQAVLKKHDEPSVRDLFR